MPAESKTVLRATACLPKNFGFSRSRLVSFAVTLIVVCPIFFLLLVDGVLTLGEWHQQRGSASAKGPLFGRDIVLALHRTRARRALSAVTSMHYIAERRYFWKPVSRLSNRAGLEVSQTLRFGPPAPILGHDIVGPG